MVLHSIRQVTLNETENWKQNIFRSVVTDLFVCGPQSPAIDDSRVWTFKIWNLGMNWSDFFLVMITLLR